ncbi:hypothetical protein AAHA92_05574 [Salvia divinorum]|uniref:Uncharacterized protein n=1 Tax=Salvia divinorum TaxID=28513 RepID=A0ABD1I3T8_SALDI
MHRELSVPSDYLDVSISIISEAFFINYRFVFVPIKRQRFRVAGALYFDSVYSALVLLSVEIVGRNDAKFKACFSKHSQWPPKCFRFRQA